MNAILGGQFSSRINLNLREDKGYTYGARSHFAFRQGPGPFEAGGAVQTDVTKEALVELIKELDRHHRRPARHRRRARLRQGPDRSRASPAGSRPPPASPARSPTWSSTTCPTTTSRPTSRRSRPSPRPTSTGSPRSTSTPSHMTILVVGDRAKVEPGLKSLPLRQGPQRPRPRGEPAPRLGPGGRRPGEVSDGQSSFPLGKRGHSGQGGTSRPGLAIPFNALNRQADGQRGLIGSVDPRAGFSLPSEVIRQGEACRRELSWKTWSNFLGGSPQ